MSSNTLAEIDKWLELADKIDQERRKGNFNLLFDIKLLHQFRKEKNKEKNIKKIEDSFVDVFGEFCKKTGVNIPIAAGENSSSPVIDSLSSLSETLYLLDKGFVLITDIFHKHYSTEEIMRKVVWEDIFRMAYSEVHRKRDAIFDFINPFREARIKYT